jgi:DNA-binding CsgD family transcriptional regulator
MGAVEHLKTLCCLGLPPESAMIAVVPLLHEILPHGWCRICLMEPDGTISGRYVEHPGADLLFRERLWKFLEDPSALASIAASAVGVVGIGWTLHIQGRGYLDTAYYREMEAPVDSCWILDAMIGDDGHTIACMQLTRPRSARPFTSDDVGRIDLLRPWLAHALRRQPPKAIDAEMLPIPRVGAPVLGGEMITTSDGRLVYETSSVSLLRAVVDGDSWHQDHPTTTRRSDIPLPARKLVRRLADTAHGEVRRPPRLQLATAYGTVALEAKWLVPVDADPQDVARDPNGCLVSVRIDLYQHPIAHAARMLREAGVTPAQVKVGVRLAMGKTKPEIARELGIRPSSVADQVKKLYQQLDVHNSTELGREVWTGQLRQR